MVKLYVGRMSAYLNCEKGLGFLLYLLLKYSIPAFGLRGFPWCFFLKLVCFSLFLCIASDVV